MELTGVSAIIPSHNRSAWIEEAIRSVISQSRPPDELIIVDDGSTDDTQDKIRPLINTAPFKIRLIYQRHQGVSSARNKGISEARYGYLAFLDSDDRWLANKLEQQIGAMQCQPDCLISHTRERWLRRGLHLNQKKKHQPAGGDIFGRCLKRCCVGMSTVVLQRRLWAKHQLFDETLPCCEDYDLWLRVASDTAFLLVDQPLTLKNGGRSDQLSYQYRIGMDVYRIQAIEKLFSSNRLSRGQQDLAAQELIRKCRIYGNGCLKHGREQEADRYLQRALAYQRYLL